MQMYLSPENVCFWILIGARSLRSLAQYKYIYFLSVYFGVLPPPPNTKKLATLLPLKCDGTWKKPHLKIDARMAEKHTLSTLFGHGYVRQSCGECEWPPGYMLHLQAIFLFFFLLRFFFFSNFGWQSHVISYSGLQISLRCHCAQWSFIFSWVCGHVTVYICIQGFVRSKKLSGCMFSQRNVRNNGVCVYVCVCVCISV